MVLTLTTDITNCWRVGFATGGKETDYETAQGTADQTLQHIVFRRVLGSRPELYINGVLSPFSFSFEDTGTPAILSSRLDFTNQKIIVGRGSVATPLVEWVHRLFQVLQGRCQERNVGTR
jgi:hypothetical protein